MRDTLMGPHRRVLIQVEEFPVMCCFDFCKTWRSFRIWTWAHASRVWGESYILPLLHKRQLFQAKMANDFPPNGKWTKCSHQNSFIRNLKNHINIYKLKLTSKKLIKRGYIFYFHWQITVWTLVSCTTSCLETRLATQKRMNVTHFDLWKSV